MALCPLYNNTNLNFTGSQNPYALIQQGGKKRTKRRKTFRKKSLRRRKTRKNRH